MERTERDEVARRAMDVVFDFHLDLQYTLPEAPLKRRRKEGGIKGPLRPAAREDYIWVARSRTDPSRWTRDILDIGVPIPGKDLSHARDDCTGAVCLELQEVRCYDKRGVRDNDVYFSPYVYYVSASTASMLLGKKRAARVVKAPVNGLAPKVVKQEAWGIPSYPSGALRSGQPVQNGPGTVLSEWLPLLKATPPSEPLTLATDCDGCGGPLSALGDLRVPFHHVFGCEIDPLIQQFIKQNPSRRPGILFDDMVARDRTGHCVIAGRQKHVPQVHMDLYIAGFPCTPFSLMNLNRKHCWDDPNSDQFFAVTKYLTEFRPKVAILENVMGTFKRDAAGKRPIDFIMHTLRRVDPNYVIRPFVVNSVQYGLPQSRRRVYIVVVTKSLLRDTRDITLDGIEHALQALSKHCGPPQDVDKLLATRIDSPPVRTTEHHRRRTEVSKNTSQLHAWIRLAMQLVDAGTYLRLNTQSFDTWNLTRRERELLDIHQQIAQQRRAQVRLVNMSQQVFRSHYSYSGVCPTVTPGMKLWTYRRGCRVLGRGMMALQGFRPEPWNFKGIPDSKIRHMAGNAMSVNVVAAVIASVLKCVNFAGPLPAWDFMHHVSVKELRDGPAHHLVIPEACVADASDAEDDKDVPASDESDLEINDVVIPADRETQVVQHITANPTTSADMHALRMKEVSQAYHRHMSRRGWPVDVVPKRPRLADQPFANVLYRMLSHQASFALSGIEAHVAIADMTHEQDAGGHMCVAPTSPTFVWPSVFDHAPSVEFSGFCLANLNSLYIERLELPHSGMSTYWTADGQFVLFWQSEPRRWAICAGLDLGKITSGQDVVWAHREDDGHFSLAKGWRELLGDGSGWYTPELIVTCRSTAHHIVQWNNLELLESIYAVKFSGFLSANINTCFHLRAGEVIQGSRSYWDVSGRFLIYWQGRCNRWAICCAKFAEEVKGGECHDVAHRTDTSHFANASGWVERAHGLTSSAHVMTEVVSRNGMGFMVTLNGFLHSRLNATYRQQTGEFIHGRSCVWSSSGEFVIYWQSSQSRWCIGDRDNLQRIHDGEEVAWAYRKDWLHFAEMDGWSEFQDGDWKDVSVFSTVLQGSWADDWEAV